MISNKIKTRFLGFFNQQQSILTNTNLKRILLWNLLAGFSLISCSKKCEPTKSVVNNGNKLMISMLECNSSQSIFDLKLNLSLAEILTDSTFDKKYIHIPKEAIELDAYEDYNYSIHLKRSDDFTIRIKILLKEGNAKEITGTKTKIVKKIDASNTVVSSGSGWTTSFLFHSTIKELSDGSFKLRLQSLDSNEIALEIFNQANAEIFENYAIELAISE